MRKSVKVAKALQEKREELFNLAQLPYASYKYSLRMLQLFRQQALRLSLLLLIAGLSCFSLLEAQAITDTRFHHLTQKDVSSQRWWRVFQSHDGFIWFTNASGLYRFDGYETQKVPLHPPAVTGSEEFSILQIIEWPVGTFWMATAHAGLLKFDIYSGACVVFQHDPADSSSIIDNYVTSIALDSTHRLWVGTPKGLNLYEPQSGGFLRFVPNPREAESLPEEPVTRMFVDREGELWVSHFKGGFSRLKGVKNGQAYFETFSKGPDHPEAPKIPFISSFKQEKPGEFWIGIPSQGLGKVTKEGDKIHIQYYGTSTSDSQSISDNSIVWIETDAQGQLWVGTHKGINAYSPQADRFYRFYHDPTDPFSIGNDRQTQLYRDRQGILWVTLLSQMDMISPFSHPIQSIRYSELESDNSPIRGVPFAVLKDSYGHLWIGTNKKGLMMQDKERGVDYHFSQENEAQYGFRSNDVLDLFEDAQQRLWIATSHGLARLDLAKYFSNSSTDFKPQFHFYPYLERGESGNAAPMRVIYDLEPDPRGGLWLATYQGLSYFDTEREIFHNLLDSTYGYLLESGDLYYHAALDKTGNLWLATHQSGLKMLPKGAPFDYRSFIHIRAKASDPYSLPSDMLKSVFVDSRNQLWVGSHQGLVRLDSFHLAKDTAFYFSPIEKNQKQSCNNIFEDKHGNVWYGTAKGFRLIRPDGSLGFEIGEGDGLPVSNASLNTSYQDKSGNIYVGTGGGISIFHPDSLRPNLIPPQVRLTAFQLFNKKVSARHWMEAGEESEMYLEKDIAYLDELRLRHDQSVLTFEYTALNYYQSEKNRYAYMMEGFDKEWVYAGERRSATYTNLDPGTYYFRVKACNNDGIWNEEGTSLRIVVEPPWWQSWWAFVIYGTIISSVLGLFLYARVRKVAREYETQARIERAKTEERESVRKRSSRDFHDEAGNKLTKLSLYTELTKRKVAGDSEAISFLDHIEDNVRELATGMRDFIWVLDPEKDTLEDTLNRIKDFGDQLFEHSETRFHYQLQLADLKDIPLDIRAKRHLLLIFKEAMNNALKYAGATNASFFAERKGNHLLVKFVDNGNGFDIEKGKRGNGLANMKARAEEIGGSLQLLSSAEEGTQLIFDMQIGENDRTDG